MELPGSLLSPNLKKQKTSTLNKNYYISGNDPPAPHPQKNKTKQKTKQNKTKQNKNKNKTKQKKALIKLF